MINHIKTADLCERCVYGLMCYVYFDCRGCPCVEDGWCRCIMIKNNTPCPYFEEVKDDASD